MQYAFDLCEQYLDLLKPQGVAEGDTVITDALTNAHLRIIFNIAKRSRPVSGDPGAAERTFDVRGEAIKDVFDVLTLRSTFTKDVTSHVLAKLAADVVDAVLRRLPVPPEDRRGSGGEDHPREHPEKVSSINWRECMEIMEGVRALEREIGRLSLEEWEAVAQICDAARSLHQETER